MWAIEHNLEPCMLSFLPQICTKMNNFKFDFSKIFWGGAHGASSPDPSPSFFSGFALSSGFVLDSQALRAFDSGFALDSRALRAFVSGLALNFRLDSMVWPPLKQIPGSVPESNLENVPWNALLADQDNLNDLVETFTATLKDEINDACNPK